MYNNKYLHNTESKQWIYCVSMYEVSYTSDHQMVRGIRIFTANNQLLFMVDSYFFNGLILLQGIYD